MNVGCGNLKVRENNKVRDTVVKVLSSKRFSSKTFSVTRLVACPRKAYYRMKGVYEVIPDSRTLMFIRGRGLHSELEKPFKFREIHKEVDGVRGDIDAIGDRVIEIYSTNLSSGKIKDADLSKKFKNKVKQLMAYCYMAGEKTGDLLVFFMSGDYSRFTEIAGKKHYTGIQPELKCWTLEFTDEELKENWKQILDNKAEVELALKTGIPPLIAGEEFECNYCGYSYTCLGEEPVAPRDINEVVGKVTEDSIK